MSLEHWEAYYRLGNLASSLMGPEPGYTQQVREAWIDFFTGLPERARVVDLGTGNGALLAIARESSAATQQGLELHGIDLARIDPVRHVPGGAELFAGVQFHALTAAESLPFEPASVNAVCGQYALEFMDLPRVMAAIRRVLAPDGRVQFIVHDADSILVENSRVSLQQSELVLDETRVLKLLKRFIAEERESPARARTGLAELTAVSNRLRREGAAIARGSFVLETTMQALAQIFEQRGSRSVAANEREIDRFELELRTAARRLRDVVAAARDETGIAAIAAMARDAGFEHVSVERQLHGDGNRVGWRIAWA